MDKLLHIPQSAFGWVLSSIPLDYLDSAKARLEWRSKLMQTQGLPGVLQILPADHAALAEYQRCKKVFDNLIAQMADLDGVDSIVPADVDVADYANAALRGLID